MTLASFHLNLLIVMVSQGGALKLSNGMILSLLTSLDVTITLIWLEIGASVIKILPIFLFTFLILDIDNQAANSRNHTKNEHCHDS